MGLGRGNEAIASYDKTLALLANASEPEVPDGTVAVLLSKGQMLGQLQRVEEAIVVYDSAVSAYRTARAAGGGTEVLWAAVLALVNKLERLCALDRSEEAHELRAQLIALLGDVDDTSSDGDRSDTGSVSEVQLAAAVADVSKDGECWRWFEARSEKPPRELMTERAIELYRLSEVWAMPGAEESGLAAHAAASMLRDIADGYAMLTRRLTPADRATLPLPQRGDAQRTQLIRTLGVDEWAAEHGHPLALPTHTPDIDEADPEDVQLLDSRRSEAVDSTEGFVRFFLISVYTYDLLTVLCDSPTGRVAFENENFRNRASWQIARARKWVRWIAPYLEDAEGAAVACVFIAQAFFLASHGEVSSRATLLPGVSTLRDLLRQSGSYDWLIAQTAELPQWLTQESD
jgi:hypothetical protein